MLLAFRKYNDFFVKNLHFFAFFLDSVCYESLTRDVLLTYGMKFVVKKTIVPSVPDGENHTILCSLVLTQYRRVTDGYATHTYLSHMYSRYTTRTVSCYECAAWTNIITIM